MNKVSLLLFVLLVVMQAGEPEGSMRVQMYLLTSSGKGEEIGTIKIEETDYGTLFIPDLTGLSPGIHGFHVHQYPDCSPAEKEGTQVPGLSAGGHLDPMGTDYHSGPFGEGHLGDLPVLYVHEDGTATLPVLAPRIRISDMRGHSLMIHTGGDNYLDEPQKLGGGGARVACGLIK
ncbi:MAG: superoxide dismutase [Cu-Zn] SodC [Fidelibacterota bacterium]